MQRNVKSHHNLGIKQLILNHISKDINIYVKVLIVFIIGICIGTAVVNKLPRTEMQSINNHITNTINLLKNNTEISKIQMLKSSLFKNVIIVLAIWFLGLTLIGSLGLYFLMLILGITFGYTLSIIMSSLTVIHGILFFITGMLLQNIINIPTIIFFSVQGIKLHENLFQKNNAIKYIIAKYSIYAIIVMILLAIASLIETYISGELIYKVIQYL